jgi:hypothetical protein
VYASVSQTFDNRGPLHRRSVHTRATFVKLHTSKIVCKWIGETLYRWLKLPYIFIHKFKVPRLLIQSVQTRIGKDLPKQPPNMNIQNGLHKNHSAIMLYITGGNVGHKDLPHTSFRNRKAHKIILEPRYQPRPTEAGRQMRGVKGEDVGRNTI